MEAEALEEKHDQMMDLVVTKGKGSLEQQVVDVEKMTRWVDEQLRYLKQTVWEMRPVEDDDNWPKDRIDEMEQ